MQARLKLVSTSPEKIFKKRALSFAQSPVLPLMAPGLERLSVGAAIGGSVEKVCSDQQVHHAIPTSVIWVRSAAEGQILWLLNLPPLLQHQRLLNTLLTAMRCSTSLMYAGSS